MEKINLYVGEQQIKDFRALAKRTGLSVAELIRRSMDAYMKQFKKGK